MSYQIFIWPAVFSFSLALVFILIALKVFPKLKLVDRPQKYNLFREPIPYYGGTVIYLAFVISIFVFVPISSHLIGFLIGSLLIALLGFFDDLFSLSPWIRLLVQFVACVVLVYFGIGILSINLPFFGELDFSKVVIYGLPLLSAIFTVVWVMTILNTMNFVDGVSGLSSGVSFVACLTIFFLSTNSALHQDPKSQLPVAMIALILAMVSLAFLLFDFPKAKILMGDSGSTFLGFAIATLAIFSGGKVATAFLVLGLPILDMAWVVIRRIRNGQKFWKGDLKHLHHRLLDLKLSEKRVVLLYLFITAALGVAAISFVSGQQKFFMIIALVILMILFAGALIFIPKKN
jgi:UDP-GlcNAc:undecaprenyl-phosphate/decaprenyl-phosphate GlcNAc-1-phosphate transferase